MAIAISFDSFTNIGYKSFYLDLGGNSHDKLEENLASRIENEFYSITVNANNTLDILDKKSGKLYQNQGIIQENGDAGDSFNYSPPREDLIINFFLSFALRWKLKLLRLSVK